MQFWQQIQLAMMMLTRLPIGRLHDPVPKLAEAAWAFPLVGLVISGIGWCVLQLALVTGLSAVLASLVALVAMVWATGALHEDGLADFADGIGGGRDASHCLEIMRDSRIGSYGVVALVFMIGLKTAALADIATTQALAALLLTGVASRLMMLVVLRILPAARADGLGYGASSPPASALLPGAVVIVVLAIILGSMAVPVLIVMGLASAIPALLAMRKIKGQTGDVLGTVQNSAETAGFVALSVLIA